MMAQPESSPKVVVHCAEQIDSMNILLTLDGKPRNFTRKMNEPLSKLLFRMHEAVTPNRGANSRPKAKGADPDPRDSGQSDVSGCLVCALFCGDDAVADTTPNCEAWAQATTLRVGETVFD
eukprot:3609638-Rhodomonas_salina.2